MKPAREALSESPIHGPGAPATIIDLELLFPRVIFGRVTLKTGEAWGTTGILAGASSPISGTIIGDPLSVWRSTDTLRHERTNSQAG
jgi:hypothetical protein